MILSESDRRSINMSALNRARNKDRLWAADDVLILKAHYPDIEKIQSLLSRPRSRRAIHNAAQLHKLGKKYHVWIAAEVKRLKTLHEEGKTWSEIQSKFPGFTLNQLNKVLGRNRPRRRVQYTLKPTGCSAIDAIIFQAKKLNYSLSDVDRLIARPGYKRSRYFSQNARKPGSAPQYDKIARAAIAMGGRIEIRFDD